MTDSEINTAIAEACGWSQVGHNGHQPVWVNLKGERWTERHLPDYANDLNAMHEAERSNEMHFDQRWVETIVEIAHRESVMNLDRTDGWDWVMIVARLKPSQRAEAFLRTIHKWEEVQPWWEEVQP